MGQLNFTNNLGITITIIVFINHRLIISATTIEPYDTLRTQSYFEGMDAAAFSLMTINLVCTSSSGGLYYEYKADIGRDEYFADKNGAFPGKDYDITLTLIGFNHELNQIHMTQSARKANSETHYIASTGFKTISRVS